MRRALLVLTVALVWAGTLGPAAAENVTVEFYRQMADEWRLSYVIGYMEGFAVATGAGQRATDLQRCFERWSNAETKTVFDLWVGANTDKNTWSARIALYAAIADACGWRRQ